MNNKILSNATDLRNLEKEMNYGETIKIIFMDKILEITKVENGFGCIMHDVKDYCPEYTISSRKAMEIVCGKVDYFMANLAYDSDTVTNQRMLDFLIEWSSKGFIIPNLTSLVGIDMLTVDDLKHHLDYPTVVITDEGKLLYIKRNTVTEIDPEKEGNRKEDYVVDYASKETIDAFLLDVSEKDEFRKQMIDTANRRKKVKHQPLQLTDISFCEVEPKKVETQKEEIRKRDFGGLKFCDRLTKEELLIELFKYYKLDELHDIFNDLHECGMYPLNNILITYDEHNGARPYGYIKNSNY